MLYQEARLDAFDQMDHHKQREHLGRVEPKPGKFEAAAIWQIPYELAVPLGVPVDGAAHAISQELDVSLDGG
jgi:hypothetical protein